jgi:hypothetical protein
MVPMEVLTPGVCKVAFKHSNPSEDIHKGTDPRARTTFENPLLCQPNITKFQYPRTTLSGREVCSPGKKRRKIIKARTSLEKPAQTSDTERQLSYVGMSCNGRRSRLCRLSSSSLSRIWVQGSDPLGLVYSLQIIS